MKLFIIRILAAWQVKFIHKLKRVEWRESIEKLVQGRIHRCGDVGMPTTYKEHTYFLLTWLFYKIMERLA